MTNYKTANSINHLSIKKTYHNYSMNYEVTILKKEGNVLRYRNVTIKRLLFAINWKLRLKLFFINANIRLIPFYFRTK